MTTAIERRKTTALSRRRFLRGLGALAGAGENTNPWEAASALAARPSAAIAALYWAAREESEKKNEEVIDLITDARTQGASVRGLISKLHERRGADATDPTTAEPG